MKFNELNLSKSILETVEKLGFEEATEIQCKCIPEIINGRDIIGKSQTGSGKTFAYGIPAIQIIDKEINAVQVLVVCPTRELAIQVNDELKKINDNSTKVVPIYGGGNMSRQICDIKKGAKIIVGTPGRLMDHLRRKTLKLNDLKLIVLDEADEMLNMGFKEDIETILKSTKEDHQTVMFSATIPQPILNLTKQYMKDAKFIEIGTRLQTVNTTKQYFVYHDKKDALVKVINKFNPNIGMVFCNTIRMVEELTSLLNKSGIDTLSLHGDMRQSARKKTIADFKSGKAQILIGTDVAARGLDIKNVEIVINYDLPYDVEYYVHRIGRTGRAGSEGKAVSLISTSLQRKQLALIEKEINQSIEQILFDDDKLVTGDKSTYSLAREKKKNTASKETKNRTSNKRGFSKKSTTYNKFDDRNETKNQNGRTKFSHDKKRIDRKEKFSKKTNDLVETNDVQDGFNTKKNFRNTKNSNSKFLHNNKNFDKQNKKWTKSNDFSFERDTFKSEISDNKNPQSRKSDTSKFSSEKGVFSKQGKFRNKAISLSDYIEQSEKDEKRKNKKNNTRKDKSNIFSKNRFSGKKTVTDIDKQNEKHFTFDEKSNEKGKKAIKGYGKKHMDNSVNGKKNRVQKLWR